VRALLPAVLLGVLTGCDLAPAAGIPAGDVPVPPFPECVAEEYAYYGVTSMAALGVSRPSGRPPPDADRVGTIWITADRRINAGEPPGMDEGRMLCIEFPDAGDGELIAMTNFPVVDSWRPPGSQDWIARAAAAPWHLLLVVVVGVVLLIGASLIAYRERR
jgi:hypothetical protein